MTLVTRRNLIVLGGAGLVAGCDAIGRDSTARAILGGGESAHYGLQRLITDRTALAREFRPEQRSPVFRVNGTANPDTPEYNAHAASRFANWRLRVDGLVARPLDLSLADLRAMPQRAQITRHDCVEGWSAIGTWTGTPLKLLLEAAGLSTNARYLVFHCADFYGPNRYYETIDLVDARHPQTILAYGLNGKPLPVENGAPLRARVERQLGYKMPKYLAKVELVSSFAAMGGGRGGYLEDYGYDWYGGI